MAVSPRCERFSAGVHLAKWRCLRVDGSVPITLHLATCVLSFCAGPTDSQSDDIARLLDTLDAAYRADGSYVYDRSETSISGGKTHVSAMRVLFVPNIALVIDRTHERYKRARGVSEMMITTADTEFKIDQGALPGSPRSTHRSIPGASGLSGGESIAFSQLATRIRGDVSRDATATISSDKEGNIVVTAPRAGRTYTLASDDLALVSVVSRRSTSVATLTVDAYFPSNPFFAARFPQRLTLRSSLDGHPSMEMQIECFDLAPAGPGALAAASWESYADSSVDTATGEVLNARKPSAWKRREWQNAWPAAASTPARSPGSTTPVQVTPRPTTTSTYQRAAWVLGICGALMCVIAITIAIRRR
jgi:hypothetical protein